MTMEELLPGLKQKTAIIGFRGFFLELKNRKRMVGMGVAYIYELAATHFDYEQLFDY